jgi:hypothetical protein
VIADPRSDPTRPALGLIAVLAWACGWLAPARADELVPYPLGPEFQVNEATVLTQRRPVVWWRHGGFVVSWSDYDLNRSSIFALRYDAAGQPLGSPARNEAPTQVQTIKRKPSVSSDNAGNFVVVWESHVNSSRPSFPTQSEIRGQLFDSAGGAQGNVFDVFPPAPPRAGAAHPIGPTRTGSTDVRPLDGATLNGFLRPENGESHPRVSRNGPGDFVVVAQYYGNFAQRFDSTGTAQGPTIHFGTSTLTGHPRFPVVAIDEQGGFVVAWENGSASGYFEALAQRFDSAGASQGPAIAVDPPFGNQSLPEVASDAQGQFVVVWGAGLNRSYGRRFDNTGTALGQRFSLAGSGSPFVGSDHNGAFVAVRSSTGDGDGTGIFARRYDSEGALQSDTFQVNTLTEGDQRAPQVAFNENGGFVVAWSGPAASGPPGDAEEILVRRYDAAGSPLGAELQANTWTTGAQTLPSVAKAADGAFVVLWESAGQGGSTVGLAGQRFDSSGTPQGSELAIFDTFSEASKSAAAVAADAADNFVLVWASRADGDGTGVFAQLFDSAGQPLGQPFQVNQTILGNQKAPRIDRASSGSFAVTWESSPIGQFQVDHYLRRYAANGVPLGDEVKVNTDPPANPGLGSTVALNDAGQCVVAWPSVQGPLAQRFGADGMPLGSPISVSAAVSEYSGAGIEEDGDFVVAWLRHTGNVSDLLARRHSSSGAPLGEEFRVNTSTGRRLAVPAISIDGQGNLGVVWVAVMSGSPNSIFGRFFDDQSQPLGDEFEVRAAPFHQMSPWVSLREPDGSAEPGRFVVIWEAGNAETTIFGRLYALGTPTPTPTPRPVGSLGEPSGGLWLPALALAVLLVASLHVVSRPSAPRC